MLANKLAIKWLCIYVYVLCVLVCEICSSLEQQQKTRKTVYNIY